MNWSRAGSSVARELTLVGLTSFVLKDPSLPPELNSHRAEFVLTEIHQILAWEQRTDRERVATLYYGDICARCGLGSNGRLEKLHSFDEFLERRFPSSRRKACYLMSIHEHLPKQPRKDLKNVGWSKATELAKLARR